MNSKDAAAVAAAKREKPNPQPETGDLGDMRDRLTQARALAAKQAKAQILNLGLNDAVEEILGNGESSFPDLQKFLRNGFKSNPNKILPDLEDAKL